MDLVIIVGVIVCFILIFFIAVSIHNGEEVSYIMDNSLVRVIYKRGEYSGSIIHKEFMDKGWRVERVESCYY